ncbi:MAG: divalent metal cation transporter [Candidatus Velthaea sp.]
MYALGWLVLLIIPMLAVVQGIAARVGTVSRKGLEDCVRVNYGPFWAYVALISILAVNIVTLGADLGGGAAAIQVITGVDYHWFLVPFAALAAALLIFARYEQMMMILRFLPLVFLLYIGAAVLAHPNWGEVLRASFIPHITWNQDMISGAIALLGTTLTSYAYVWETIEVSEERPPLRRLGLVQADAALGIVVAGIVFWFILVATGATLGAQHHHVETAQDAAAALIPIAGKYAGLVFGIGLFGSALIAVPVLAGTSAYVLSETFRWRHSLDATFARAPRFYWSVIASIVAGTAVAFLPVAPIKLLFIAGIAGGIATPVTLVLLMRVATDRNIMKHHRRGPRLAFAGWCVVFVVAAATVAYFISLRSSSG